MEPRIKNPATLLPDAFPAIQALMTSIQAGEVPKATLDLVHLRASQINGCHLCLDTGTCYAKQTGETDDRISAIEHWQTATLFTDAERAALALAEAVTRLSDRADPVPDAIWNEAARYYDERGLAALVLYIGTTNLFNRINIATKQVGGDW